MVPVSDEALQIAHRAARRSKHRTAQVRRLFVQRADTTAPDPPLARFLRGGRGGEVRLKVYLTLLWIGSGGSHDVKFAPRAYARLFDKDDPDNNGARKVNDALDWLSAQGFIELERRHGREPVATLLRDDGSRAPYDLPGGAAREPKTEKTLPGNYYFRIPPSFWTRGWVAYLPAPAVAMLLVLLARSRNKRLDGIWISPNQLKDWYGFSDDTRRRGIETLESVGLVCVGRRAVDADFEFRRVRNTYSIEPGLLDCSIDTGARLNYRADVVFEGLPKHDAWSRYVQTRMAETAKTTNA